MKIITLGEEQRKIYKILEKTHDHIFVTGRAGTGKSVLLQYFIRHTRKNAVVVAPTGVAAVNVGGQTIHSLFYLQPSIQDVMDRNEVRRMNEEKRNLLCSIDVLVIDEVSMVSADVMDMIDAKLRYARGKKDEPFGGCQIIAFGDLYQLPPVAHGQEEMLLKQRYETIYFFGAEAAREAFKIYELQHVFRQEDQDFIDILNGVRNGTITSEMLDRLNERQFAAPAGDHCITLTSTNRVAGEVNRWAIQELPGGNIYGGTIHGDFGNTALPTDLNLHLKIGEQVMMVRNDIVAEEGKEPRWVNGTLATVSDLSDYWVEVEIDGEYYEVDQAKWEKFEYWVNPKTHILEKNVVATFTQYPLKPAYAITIHKSQGQTYDAVNINLGRGAFAPGQTYVALSRCRSLETLSLVNPIQRRDIMVDPEVVKFMEGKLAG